MVHRIIGKTVAKRNKVLAELLNCVAQMPLFTNEIAKPDLFGDAYVYLMDMYAANAGKKGGQYFTPADVFRNSCNLEQSARHRLLIVH